MMKQFIRIFVLILIAFPVAGALLTSCSEEDSCASGRAMLWSTFYMPREIASDEWVAAQLDSLTVTALGKDSVLVNNQKNVQYISLPLQYTAESTAVELKFTENLRDTVVFTHTNTQYFVSMECGFDMHQSVTEISYTTHFIESIEIRNNETSRDAKDNLRFYFPSTLD